MAESETDRSPRRRVAVIGGGIAGLSAAFRLRELAPDVDVALYEAGPRLGGVIQTERVDGYLIERSADSFITNPPTALDLCRRLGLEQELIGTNPACRSAYVVFRGRLVKLPEGFTLMTAARLGPVLTTPILSAAGKLRLFGEALVPRRRDSRDESFADFARRRVGREAYERLVQPLIAGIYTADPEKLSMQAALPRFVEMEGQHGSLFKGVRAETARRGQANGSGARYSLFMTPRAGLSTLIDALAARLPQSSARLNARIDGVRRIGDRWSLACSGESAREFDALVVATSSAVAASLLIDTDSQLAGELNRIEYAGCVIAVLGYRREQISHPLDAFGVVVPEIEKRPILALSLSSVKFAGRAPDDRVLVRAFVGGACHPELHAGDDDQIRSLATKEVAELLGATGEPELCRIARWDRAMPQYHVGHKDVVARINERVKKLPGLALAGNAYDGVGIPLCVASSERAAERILAALRRSIS